MASAAQYASQTLSTLSRPSARSHTQRSECVPHNSTNALAHHQRHGARWMWCGEGWWECFGGQCERAWASPRAARSECVPHDSTTTLAHRQRCASLDGAVRVSGRVGGEVGRAYASYWATA
eukprot:1305276-Prymnesium_polylepis.2